jgi:hypothetical protein
VLSGHYSRGVTSSDDVLSLVRQALDEFDDRPLEVSVRRAVRIASLVGDSRTAVRLAYELRPIGGDRTANGTDVKRLMVDPSIWVPARGHLKKPCRSTSMTGSGPAIHTTKSFSFTR